MYSSEGTSIQERTQAVNLWSARVKALDQLIVVIGFLPLSKVCTSNSGIYLLLQVNAILIYGLCWQ